MGSIRRHDFEIRAHPHVRIMGRGGERGCRCPDDRVDGVDEDAGRDDGGDDEEGRDEGVG